MYPELQKELETFERRTPKSAQSHQKNLKRIPLGVFSRDQNDALSARHGPFFAVELAEPDFRSAQVLENSDLLS